MFFFSRFFVDTFAILCDEVSMMSAKRSHEIPKWAKVVKDSGARAE